MYVSLRREVGSSPSHCFESLRHIVSWGLSNQLLRPLFPWQAFDTGTVNKDTFNPSQVYVLSLMETESLAEFLKSDVHSTLKKRIADGEMEALVKEDGENVKDVMSKEVRVNRNT